MAVTACAERRSSVVATVAAVLLVVVTWLAVLVASAVPAARDPFDDTIPRGPVLSPQRWDAGARVAAVGWIVEPAG